jgi:hypothetical protein
VINTHSLVLPTALIIGPEAAETFLSKKQ